MTASFQYRENTLRFGPDQRLIGTLTLPRDPAPSSLPGLILFNAGALQRIGPHRLNVEMARTAAVQGMAAIRFDLPGLGDSGFINTDASHDEQAFTALADAMTLLAEGPCAPRRFVIAGLCSGADVGFEMALRDPRVAGLFMIEPWYFPNRYSAPLRTLRRLREYGPRRALLRIIQLLRGHRNHPGGTDSPAMPAMPPDETVRASPSPTQFSSELRTLLSRGLRIRLIYANTLMGSHDLRQHQQDIFQGLGPASHFDVEMVPGTDHLFTRVESRQLLIRRLAEWLRRFADESGAVRPAA
ncbi:MAG: hypothetical protein Q4D19_02420 [Lautropia sp.]|nr:hypothetical protein [Lautropia sp.]